MADVLRNLDWSVLTGVLISIIPAILCMTIHECAHGFVAYKLGDPTAKNGGRLTLNPLKHIDVIGLVMLAVFHFGWAKPVPIDMRNFKYPKRGMAISALAGPLSNVLLSIVFLFLYGFFFPLLQSSAFGEIVLQVLYMTAYISIAFAVFNIIPIPPLDGSKVLYSVISDRAYFKLMRYERYGMFLLVLLVATGILGRPLSEAVSFIVDRLFVIAEGAYEVSRLIF